MTDARDRDGQLAILLGFLDHDPNNAALLVDAAEAAIDAGEPDQATALLERAAAVRKPTQREGNLAGLAALRGRRFEDAAAVFAALLDDGADEPALRFNLAWARTMTGDRDGALAVLDDRTAEELPQAAALDVQLLHTIGRLDEAFDRGKRYLTLHPDAPALAAAMSVLAIDMGDEALAAACAEKAPGHPDALATLGTLALGSDNAVGAEALFDAAIAGGANVPRAWVGRGLAYMLAGKPDQAPADIDRGAAMFGDHLGSWIAAGWAHFIAGDATTSRTRFEHALALDPTFAETHGSLAVLDALAGDIARARERASVALRLDRNGFSAALAMALVNAAGGDAAQSRAIVERALHMPIDGGTKTLAQSLARMGMNFA